MLLVFLMVHTVRCADPIQVATEDLKTKESVNLYGKEKENESQHMNCAKKKCSRIGTDTDRKMKKIKRKNRKRDRT